MSMKLTEIKNQLEGTRAKVVKLLRDLVLKKGVGPLPQPGGGAGSVHSIDLCERGIAASYPYEDEHNSTAIAELQMITCSNQGHLTLFVVCADGGSTDASVDHFSVDDLVTVAESLESL